VVAPLIKKGKLEQRVLKNDEISFRFDEESEQPKIIGLVSRFNSLSQDLGGFREKVAPGSFKKTIGEADIRALWNHDPSYVLGRNTSGTLELSETEDGLEMRNVPPDTQWAKDLMVSMKRGDVNQMSFGFRVIKDNWDDVNGEVVRTIIEAELFDVSVVTYPAYLETNAAVRHLFYSDEFKELAEVLNKVNRGEQLEKEDRIVIENSFDKLRNMVLDEEPVKPKDEPITDDHSDEDGHSEDEPIPDESLIKKRERDLQLAEALI
jgi:HK97 family phage prohead protease